MVVGTNRDEMKLWQEGQAELSKEKLQRRVGRMLGRAEERAPEVALAPFDEERAVWEGIVR